VYWTAAVVLDNAMLLAVLVVVVEVVVGLRRLQADRWGLSVDHVGGCVCVCVCDVSIIAFKQQQQLLTVPMNIFIVWNLFLDNFDC